MPACCCLDAGAACPVPAALALVLLAAVRLAAQVEPEKRIATRDELRAHALSHPGDASTGQRIFSAGRPVSCASCHRVRGEGAEVGPDLSEVGGKLDRSHLVEALLEPSRQIVEGYRSTVLVLKDGRLFVGILKGETPEELRLADASGRIETMTASDVSSRSTSATSIMPESLVDALSPRDFADLVAYLESLRHGRRPSPGEGITGPLELPPGFAAEVVGSGLTGATALEVLPDGRILISEQTGAIRIVHDGKLLAGPAAQFEVDSTWERGLIGVAADPGFASNGFVYAAIVARTPYPHHEIVRVTLAGDKATPGSELVLFEGDDQTKLGGNVPAGHQGGALHFGADEKLYLALGEQTAGLPSQDMGSFLGKMLRIERDGSIPADNPFASQGRGNYGAIFALGLRNPFTFAVDPRSGRIFANDVGGVAEEVDEIRAGRNYGWPAVDHGPTHDPRFTGPIHSYPTASISGAAFAPEGLAWPEPYPGRYFFMDFVHGWIHALDPDHPDRIAELASGLRRPVDLRFSRDGALYVLVRDAWVIDGEFRAGTGALLAIRPRGSDPVRVTEQTLFGDMDCLVIETQAGSYVYGKRGAGFASILDPDGRDWISYRPGAKAAGEYRGLPKCGQPVKYFHCGHGFGQYATSNPFTTTWARAAPDHVTVRSVTRDGAAACAWDFFPDRATMTLEKVPGDRFWFLYEGTPGGELDADDFTLRPGGRRLPVAEPWKEIVPWVAFGARESSFALLCVNHQTNSPSDSFVAWPYRPDAEGGFRQMTVFGFGRPDWKDPEQHSPRLSGLPARFTIALTTAGRVESAAQALAAAGRIGSE